MKMGPKDDDLLMLSQTNTVLYIILQIGRQLDILNSFLRNNKR